MNRITFFYCIGVSVVKFIVSLLEVPRQIVLVLFENKLFHLRDFISKSSFLSVAMIFHQYSFLSIHFYHVSQLLVENFEMLHLIGLRFQLQIEPLDSSL